MIKKVLTGIAILVVGFLVFVAVKPGEFTISRSILINTPASTAFDLVNDFHKMQEWSPFMKMDSTAAIDFFGSASGTGAGYSWDGSGRTGRGRMTIVDSRENELIGINLEFSRPFKAVNSVEFKFEPRGDQTKVTWSMSGHNTFVPKAFSTIFNMDKMVGSEFEKGLAAMKAIAEGKNKG
jgi:hypothetical protein